MRPTRALLSLFVLSTFPAFALAQEADQPPEPAPVPVQGEMAEPDPGDYRVGVEDVLRIVVWGETQLSGAVTVRPDGKITIPLASDIKVDGLTPEQVRDLIAAALSDYVRDPNVTVVVQSIRHSIEVPDKKFAWNLIEKIVNFFCTDRVEHSLDFVVGMGNEWHSYLLLCKE